MTFIFNAGGIRRACSAVDFSVFSILCQHFYIGIYFILKTNSLEASVESLSIISENYIEVIIAVLVGPLLEKATAAGRLKYGIIIIPYKTQYELGF